MKKLSDYKNDEAIELWADLLEPMNTILSNEEVRAVIQSGQSKLVIAKSILKTCNKEAEQILLTIDPTPIDGMNLVLRLVALLADIGQNEEIKGFFGYAEQEQTEKESGGLPTENTEVEGI